MKQALKDLFISENEEDVRLAFEIAKRTTISSEEVTDLFHNYKRWSLIHYALSSYMEWCSNGSIKWIEE